MHGDGKYTAAKTVHHWPFAIHDAPLGCCGLKAIGIEKANDCHSFLLIVIRFARGQQQPVLWCVES